MKISEFGRWQAFAVHLGISLMIFVGLLSLIVLVWYPQPFFSTDGGWQGIQLIAGVDIVLGPLLTLIVFKKGKPSLKFDLSVIALIQISALSGGIWIVHQERPVAVIFNEDRFIPVPVYQFQEAGMQVSDLDRFGDILPVPVYLDMPEDLNERSRLFFESRRTGQPMYFNGELYRSLTLDYIDKLIAASVNLDDYINGRSAEEQKIYQEFLGQYPDAREKYLFLPLHSRLKTFITVLAKKDLSFVTSLAITPPTDYFAQGGEITVNTNAGGKSDSLSVPGGAAVLGEEPSAK